MITTFIGNTIVPDPAIALLNKKPPDVTYLQFKLLLQVTTAAKQTIAKAWKTPHLTILEIKNRVTRAMVHAKIEGVLLDRVKKFKCLWRPWVDHFLPPNFDNALQLP